MPTPERVLLIDDDDDDRLIFSLALLQISPDIELLFDLDSSCALTRLSDSTLPRLDFIFLDWNMPRLDGKDCLAAIRADARYDDIPIIMISTSSAMEYKETARQLGASYFLPKPATIGELAKSLEAIFGFDWTVKFSEGRDYRFYPALLAS